jgi:hypothetical protein
MKAVKVKKIKPMKIKKQKPVTSMEKYIEDAKKKGRL